MKHTVLHYLVIETDDHSAPQIFVLAYADNMKYIWMGMRMLHLINDRWCPFVQSYHEGCPIVDFRYFYIPGEWRKHFFRALFTKEVPKAFRDAFFVIDKVEDVVDYLESLAGVIPISTGDSMPLYALALLIEEADRVLKGEKDGTSLYDFTQPIYHRVQREIVKAKESQLPYGSLE